MKLSEIDDCSICPLHASILEREEYEDRLREEREKKKRKMKSPNGNANI